MSGRVLLSWSSGKDSAWALHTLRRQGYEVAGLLTTFEAGSERVGMHGTPRALVEAQARAAGIEPWPVLIPPAATNTAYEAAMAAAMERARAAGIEAVAFGDLFLEDIRRYRQEKLAPTGVRPLFPLWGRETRELAEEMLAGGLRAVVVAVDTTQAPAELCGRPWDEALVAALPAGVDPCGENGEFHTFAWAGPMFAGEIAVEVRGVAKGERFVLAELAAADGPGPADG